MTQPETPEQVELEQSGRPIPEWFNGYRMYRNGPRENMNLKVDQFYFSDGRIRPPKIAFFIYRFPNARTVRRTLSAVLDCLEVSLSTFSLKQTDFGIRYMHQGLMTGDYFLGMFSSTKS